MKKLLSVLLAVLMIFSVLSVSAFAGEAEDAIAAMEKTTAGSTNGMHVVIHYDTRGFALTQSMPVYNQTTGGFDTVNGLSGSYYQIPRSSEELYVGGVVYLPLAQSTETQQFNGWYCAKTNSYHTAGRALEIKEEMIDPYTGCIELVADSVPAVAEEDTMATIMNILCKIFGAIIGILFYNGNTAAGVELMQGIIGGIGI